MGDALNQFMQSGQVSMYNGRPTTDYTSLPFYTAAGTTPGGGAQPTSPGTAIPTNPANQGPKPQGFGLADLEYLYRQNDPGKLSDIQRILKPFGGQTEFSLSDLQSGGNLKGLSPRSMQAWNQALQTLGSAFGAGSTAPSTGGNQTPTGTSPNGMQTGGTNPWGDLAAFMPPQTQTQNFLTQLLGIGPSALNPAPGMNEFLLNSLFAGGPGGLTTPAGGLEQLAAQLLGGGPGSFTAQAGPSEQLLASIVGGGPGQFTLPQTLGETAGALTMANPFINALAMGQLPPGMREAFENEMEQARFNTLEQFGQSGNRFGSDVAEQLMRQESYGRANLLAQTEQQALNAFQALLGGAQGLGGMEIARTQPALSAWTQLLGQAPALETARTIGGMNLFGNLIPSMAGLEANRQGQGTQNYLNLGQLLFGNETGQSQQGMQNWLNLAQMLFGTETGQANNALNLGYNEFVRQTGLPPEIAALLGVGQLSQGYGTQVSTTPGPSLFQNIASGVGAVAPFFTGRLGGGATGWTGSSFAPSFSAFNPSQLPAGFGVML